MASEEAYRVRIEAFEGPMDLLLYLARRAEVDLIEIPISVVAAQYLEHLAADARVDVDEAGDFLVDAAVLTELKARRVGLRDDRPEEAEPPAPAEADDPISRLAEDLSAFMVFRSATERLGEMLADWERQWPLRGAQRAERAAEEASEAEDSDSPSADLEDLSISDLAAAFARVAAVVDFGRVGDHRVVDDQTPIEVHAEQVVAWLGSQGESAPLTRVLSSAGVGSAGERIGRFLAVLELVRQQRVMVVVDEHEEVRVLLKPAGEGA